MSEELAKGVQEHLRPIVGPKGWDYAVFWQLQDETRTLDWTGCCCSGAVGYIGKDTSTSGNIGFNCESASSSCPDVGMGYHPAILICSLLANMPPSVPLDSGIHGKVFCGGQPEWVHGDPSVEEQEMAVKTKVFIPVQSGLVELGVSNHVTENTSVVQYVRIRCGEPWPDAGILLKPCNFPTTLDGSWPSSHPWEQENPMLESQLMGGVDHGELMNQLTGSTTHTLHYESPKGSALSKDDGEGEKFITTKEMRGESSDCSEPMDDDEEKGGGSGSGRRHLSKNLVAERKRRKKLNERLYSLRALVPKITKMDRASILGDAIEYVKELQQQVKELQEELVAEGKESNTSLGLVKLEGAVGTEDHLQTANTGIGATNQCPLENNPQDVTLEVVERAGDEALTQPMQVQVNKIDGQLLSLRIFCEKQPGVFVKLMQALDVLGLNVVHANITTFRSLVLNILNAEVRDKEQLVSIEQVRETLLEMASQWTSSDCPNLQPPTIDIERGSENVA